MVLYRDGNMPAEEKSVAHEAAAIYAEFFDTLRDKIHPDWCHDWPTREEILGNYFVHSSSYSNQMGVRVALDVMGGPVRVVYARGRSASHTGQVKKPLELFSRKARTIAQNPANMDRTWEDAVNLMKSYPPTLLLPSTAPSTRRSRDQQRCFYLPSDVVYPRCLELRGTINTKSLYRNVFPRKISQSGSISYESEIEFQRDGKLFIATFYQLRVELDGRSPYSHRGAVQEDDRNDGSPSTAKATEVYLRVVNPSTKQFIFDASLRLRMSQSYSENGTAFGQKWNPQMDVNDSEPLQYRVGDLVKLGYRPGTSPLPPPPPPSPYPLQRRSSSRSPAAVSTSSPSLNPLISHFMPTFSDFSASVATRPRGDSSRARSGSAHASPSRATSHSHSLGIRQQGIYRKRSGDRNPL